MLALIEVDPFKVLKTFAPDSAPEPMLWPDGSATHATSVGFRHGPWMLVPTRHNEWPGEFYTSEGERQASFDGTTVTFIQKYVGLPLEHVRDTLRQRINAAAETARAKVITIGAGQSVVYALKHAEATALKAWLGVHPGETPDAKSYPLLAASGSLKDSMQAVLAASERSIPTLAAIETVRLSALKSLDKAQSVYSAISVYNALQWP